MKHTKKSNNPKSLRDTILEHLDNGLTLKDLVGFGYSQSYIKFIRGITRSKAKKFSTIRNVLLEEPETGAEKLICELGFSATTINNAARILDAKPFEFSSALEKFPSEPLEFFHSMGYSNNRLRNNEKYRQWIENRSQDRFIEYGPYAPNEIQLDIQLIGEEYERYIRVKAARDNEPLKRKEL